MDVHALTSRWGYPPTVMKLQCHTSRLIFGLLWLNTIPSLAQLTWDANGDTAGQPNGSGTWTTNVANLNWWNGTTNVAWTNSPTAVAVLGGGVAPTIVSPATTVVTINDNLTLGGILFKGYSALPTSGQQYALQGATAGVTLDFGAGGLIQLEDNASGGSQFISFGTNLVLKGSDLTFQKSSGNGVQFVNLSMTSNPELTGNLTIGGSVYLGIATSGTVSAVDRVIVAAGGTANLSGSTPTYTKPFSLAGFGSGLLGTGTPYGAIRIGASNITLSGEITLTGNAGIHTNYSTSTLQGYTGTVISGPITDGGNLYEFHRFALGKGNGTLALTAANTYGGATVLGRATSGYTGGITILDFAAASAPVDDIVYNGLSSAGALSLIGGNIAPTVLRLTGKDATTNEQRFGNVTVSGTHSAIELTSGAGGAVNLRLGTLTRGATSSTLTISGPASGAVFTTQADGFIGPWVTYAAASGARSWAQVVSGVMTAGFAGNAAYVTAGSLSDPAFTAASHVGITSASTGPVSQGTGTVNVSTVSMTDDLIDRQLVIGSGNTLRLGSLGGIQLVAGARNLTVGAAGVASSLSAGGSVTNTAGQMILSNHSASSLLTIHSNIVNNGTGAVLLINQGAVGARTILAGTNTYSGGTQVSSGILEVMSNGALSTTGTVTVLEGATLGLSGGVTVNRALASIAGLGDGGLGAIRSMNGDNRITGLITQTGPALITADAGSTLTIQLATASTSAIAGGFGLTFAGNGNIAVNSRVAIGTLGVIKNGLGKLTFAGDNNFSGAITLNQGVLQAAHANALGTTGGATSIASGAALELSGGITLAAEPITLTSGGVNNAGGIRNVSGNNTLTGVITLNGTTVRIHSDTGLLTLDNATGNATLHNSGSSRTLVFGGAGDIRVLDPMARTGVGAFTLTKEGAGTTTLATTVNNTVTTISAGVLHLDFSAASSPLTNILNNVTAGSVTLSASTLKITGRSGAANAQTLGNLTLSNYANLQILQNGASSMNVTVGTLTRNWSSFWGIDLPTTGSVRTAGGTDGQVISNDGRVYAFIRDAVNGDEWAATDMVSGGLRNVVKLSSLGGYTASSLGSLSGHANIAEGVLTTTLTADTSISSLRFAQAQNTNITQDATGRILETGGILVSSTVGANTSTISTLSLRPTASTLNNPELMIMQNNPLGSLVLESRIINRLDTGRTVVSVTKAGPGLVVMKGANTFTGNLRVYEGAVQFAAGSVSSGMEFLLGTGANSGRIILGDGATAFSPTIDYIEVVGVGTDNRIVGGASAISILSLGGTTTTLSPFATGFLGGPGTNENNLALSFNRANAMLTLGAANSYVGKTTLRAGTIEVASLADAGQNSSLGQGTADPVIDMGLITSGTTAVARLRHVGTELSSTNRVINLANSSSATTSLTAILENEGTGFLQFTSAFTSTGTNLTATRTLVLGGTNTGANQIVGIGNNGSVGTALQKTGVGAWTITGDSTHSGGTSVEAGKLLVTNASGSGTGTGSVNVLAGATLGGSGRIAPGADRSVTITGGTLQVGAEVSGQTPIAGRLTIQTSGTGSLSLLSGSIFSFDLITGAGLGDNTGIATSADLAVILGVLNLGEDTILRVANPTNMTAWAANDQWRLFDWSEISGPVSGTVSQYDLPTLPEGLIWNTDDLFNTGILSISLVPEPSRAIFIIFGILSLLISRRRGLFSP